MGLVVLVALGIVPFAPQLGAAIQEGGWIVPTAKAATPHLPVASRHEPSAAYMVAADLELDAPGCIVEVEGRAVRPEAHADGSYRISPVMVLTDACFPKGSS